MDSRMVADPLRLLHCCPISDGAAAVVLTAERGPVRIAGIGQGADALAVRHRADVTHFRATRDAARAAFAMAGFGPARIDFAEIHDAFAPFELISLEDLNLVPPGKAGRATLDGETALDGRLPVNPSRGHRAGAGGGVRVAADRTRGRATGGGQRRARAVDRWARHEQLGHDPRARSMTTAPSEAPLNAPQSVGAVERSHEGRLTPLSGATPQSVGAVERSHEGRLTPLSGATPHLEQATLGLNRARGPRYK